MRPRLALLLALSLALPLRAGLMPVQLTCEHLPAPEAVDSPHPRLSWRVENEDPGARNQVQSAYRIVVAKTPGTVSEGQGVLWDTGKVPGDQTRLIPYAGVPLESGLDCFFKVKVWDQDGRESAWSESGRWRMGLLNPEDWTAEWIAFRDPSPVHRDPNTLHLPPARHYRKTFAVTKPVRRAVVFYSALGLADLHVNGALATDAWFAPGWADYTRRVHYRAQNITALLKPGDNTVGAVVADGWYAGYVGFGLLAGHGPFQTGRSFYGTTPALLAQVRIEYADGSAELVVTDASWQVSGDGPVREADLIMGESHDARRERPRWCTPGGAADWTWENAIPAAGNGPKPATYRDTLGERQVDLGFRAPPVRQAYAAPPIRVTQELPVQRVTEPAPGVWILDFGQNFAGVIRLKVKGAAGATVKIRYGERLHPDGRLTTENHRRARATDFYTLRGAPDGEVWSPRFTYHAFQYVELSGLPDKPAPDSVTGLVLHNDTPLTSSFACSDEALTRSWKSAQWTQRANFIEIPTDGSPRDERLGWMGDAQFHVRAAACNADVAAFFTKWVDDVREAQRESGAYPDHAPYPLAHGEPGATPSAAWTDAGVIVPHAVWQVYGDTRILERHWDSMTRFMAWRAKSDPDLRGATLGTTWGDRIHLNEETPIAFIDLVHHAHDCRIMAEMAAALGRSDEAKAYAQRFETLSAHFREAYGTGPEGRVSLDTQTAAILALWAGVLPDESQGATVARLVQKIAANGNRMTTDFLGTRAILPVLSAHGHHDLAVKLFTSGQFPRLGEEVGQGAINGQNGAHDASLNTFRHSAFGAGMEWAFHDLAGIQNDGPGFRRMHLVPGIPTGEGGLRWVKASYDSPHGRVESHWRRQGAGYEYRVTVPANTRARVELPGAGVPGVTLDDAPLGRAIEVNRRVFVEVGSGDYVFRVK